MIECIILSKIKLWVWILREQHFMYRDQGLLQLCSRKDSYCNASSSSYYKKKNNKN